eukprot:COSAG06_NODE_1487_length_9296_cov_19.025226_16_plen_60_part_00
MPPLLMPVAWMRRLSMHSVSSSSSSSVSTKSVSFAQVELELEQNAFPSTFPVFVPSLSW